MSPAEYEQLVAFLGHQFSEIDRRFDQVDGRFGEIDRRFAEAARRFDQIDGRFGEVDRSIAGLRQEMLGHGRRARGWPGPLVVQALTSVDQC